MALRRGRLGVLLTAIAIIGSLHSLCMTYLVNSMRGKDCQKNVVISGSTYANADYVRLGSFDTHPCTALTTVRPNQFLFCSSSDESEW